MPSRNVWVTARCAVCGETLPAGRPRKTCSDRCRVAAWRRRHQPEPAISELPPARSRKDAAVYECPSCGERLLGEQYCESCHTFMRRAGMGGSCPCCGELVTLDELLDA